MGNAESGPEVASPRAINAENSSIVASSLVYSGGKALAVRTSPYSKTPKQQQLEEVRQPHTTHHQVEFEATSARESHESGIVSSRYGRVSPRSQAIRPPPVTFHTVPLEKISEVPDVHDVEPKNSIVQGSGSETEQEEDWEDQGEISRLYKRITKLGEDVIEATAAVYHYLETNSLDDEMTVSGRSNAVLKYIKKAADRGNTQPAYKFLETAKAVSEVLEEEEMENDDEGTMSPIFRLLRDTNDQESIGDRSVALTRLLEETGPLDGGGSVFRMLDDDEVFPKPLSQRRRDLTLVRTSQRHWEDRLIDCDDDCLPLELLPTCSPRTQATLKAKGGSGNAGPLLEYFSDRHVPEEKSTGEDSEDGNKWTRKDLFVYRGDDGDFDDNNESQVDVTDLPHMHAIDENMDLEFVERFDIAFNEFIVENPDLLADHPDLVHNLRILKLQQLLEHNDRLEQDLSRKVENANAEKEAMEENIHGQLKEAARRKAARQTFLQSELNNLSWSTKRVQAQLRWKFLQYSEDRAKRQFKMRQRFKAIPVANTISELVALIPEGTEGRRLKDVIQAAVKAEGTKPYMLSILQEKQLREFQAENSVMSAELSILTNKITELRMEAKKYAWVESVLVRLDEGTLYKLKSKFQKKEGVDKL